MNKEIEELLNMLKKCAGENKATLKLNEIACKTILLYIEQLENNRDKAIEWVNNNLYTYKADGITIYDWDSAADPKKLLEILEDKK